MPWLSPGFSFSRARKCSTAAASSPSLRRASANPPRAHVGAGFEKTPEMTVIFLEAFGTERELPSFESARVEIASFGRRGGFCGQEVVSVRAERRDGERLVGERDARAGRGAVPRFVHDVLRLGDCVIAAAGGDRRQIALHRSPVRQRAASHSSLRLRLWLWQYRRGLPAWLLGDRHRRFLSCV